MISNPSWTMSVFSSSLQRMTILLLLTSTLLIGMSHSTNEYDGKIDEQQHWFFGHIVSSSASQWSSPFDDEKKENDAYQDDNKMKGTGSSSSSQPPCRCWNLTDGILQQVEIECKCSGQIVQAIPRNLPGNVQHITMYECGLQVLRSGELQIYADTLSDFVLDKVYNLAIIEEGAFRDLIHLQRIYIRGAPLLITLPESVFSLFLPSLNILLIKHTGLRSFPNLSGLETSNILHTVDLGSNHIESIPSNSVRLRVDDFSINDNRLRSIELFAFNGSQIATLNLKGNTQLVEMDPDAFAGLTSLRRLDASQTAITQLPTRGLSELEILRLTDTKSLKEIPSVYNYQWLREAHLTYPYHCCAFAFPATHDPQEHARHQQTLAEMQEKYCNPNSSDAAVLQDEDSMMYDNEQFIDLSIPSGVIGSSSMEEQLSDGGIFHLDTFQAPSNRQLLFHAFCGNLSAQPKREVFCTPQPDAFNPCEDILGAAWLRTAAWLVSVASVVGNLAVVSVLIHTSRCPMAVSKFLMVNLALADLCMGFYLFLILGMDVNTMGVYFNYAIDWQNGLGCQVAGFLTVFATELSVFTLVVITTERWYTITYAINLSRRLRLSTTVKIVAAGWIGSLTMAALPLTGVSSFSTTSICLPLENRNLSDTIYLLLLLILNGLAFLFICLCYGLMYRSISGQHQTLASHSDATVAKRMAVLVFTNLVCWTPIAFFGLTAVAGYPLISVTHTKILLVFFYPLNACTNPYLYALLTKQYRRDFFQLLGRYGLCKEQVNRFSRTTTSCGKSNPIRAGSQLELAMGVKKTQSPGSPSSKSATKRLGSGVGSSRRHNSQRNETTKRNAYRYKAEPEEELDSANDQPKQLPIDSIHHLAEDGTAIVVVVSEPMQDAREDKSAAVVVYHRVNKPTKISVRSSSCTSRLNSSDSPHPVKNHQIRVSSQADTELCASKLFQSKEKGHQL